jgi:transposase
MPAPHPPEFRRRAVELAREGAKPVAKLAKDLGISESCLRNWMAQADADDNGSQVKLTSTEKKELAELRRKNGSLKWKTRSSSAPPLTSRGRASSQSNFPAGPRARRRRYSRRGGLPGAERVGVRVLRMARTAGISPCDAQ